MSRFIGSLALVLMLGPCVTSVSARSAAAPTGYTGSPVELVPGRTCGTHHAGASTPAPVGAMHEVGLTELGGGAFTAYEPGTTYTLELSTQYLGRDEFGFSMIGLAGTTQAGSFATSAMSAFATANTTDIMTGYTYHTHSTAPDGQPDTVTWIIDWTAPATDEGDINFFFCTLAANGNNRNSGDTELCDVVTISPGAVATDEDGDGLDGPTEMMLGTSDMDIDSDDDGVADGDEVLAGLDPAVCDTDGDGLFDGLEQSVTMPLAGAGPVMGTDVAAGCFTPDADPATSTDPLDVDSDDDGISDSAEDANLDGALSVDETDAADCDSDGDGLPDGLELSVTAEIADPDGAGPLLGTDIAAFCDPGGLFAFFADADPMTSTDPLDADSDDDGISDFDEDTTANGLVDVDETSPSNCDTDGDGLPDGLELSVLMPVADPDDMGLLKGTDTDAPCGMGLAYVLDADGMATTSPLEDDSDGDGCLDGEEDANGDGAVSAGESDPAVGGDCAVGSPARLRLASWPTAGPGDVALMLGRDPCTTTGDLRACEELGTDLGTILDVNDPVFPFTMAVDGALVLIEHDADIATPGDTGVLDVTKTPAGEVVVELR
ncbi:MAG: choice-of-anchor V domain-containing protein [Acidobacteriota bacterium]